MENRGDIDLDFKLCEPRVIFGPLFRFNPNTGHLKVGEQIKIDVIFQPDSLGQIYEEFEWELNGSPEPLILTFKGKSVGPSIHANIDEICFGKVSYGFSSQKAFQIINTSQISVKYEIRLKAESNCDIRDFKITKQFGIIDELSNEPIEIELSAMQLKPYKLSLLVDIHNVQKEVIKIPISGNVVVPSVSIRNR